MQLEEFLDCLIGYGWAPVSRPLLRDVSGCCPILFVGRAKGVRPPYGTLTNLDYAIIGKKLWMSYKLTSDIVTAADMTIEPYGLNMRLGINEALNPKTAIYVLRRALENPYEAKQRAGYDHRLFDYYRDGMTIISPA